MQQAFDDHKYPSQGAANPSIMDKPFWKYMICNADTNAWSARNTFSFPYDGEVLGDGSKGSAVFSFERFGQTETVLPDGRSVFIAGEHEDYYDPDFYIYNDVVVINQPWPLEERRPGDVTIYGYPKEVFPPTDFHTATYVEDVEGESWIYVIGSLGYMGSRSRSETEVYRLKVADFSIHRIETTGAAPEGGCSRHSASLQEKEGKQCIVVLWKGSEYTLDVVGKHWTKAE